MRFKLYLLLVYFSFPTILFAQDYFSVASGEWTSSATWNKTVNGVNTPLATGEYPTYSNSSSISIRANTTVTLTAGKNISIDQTVVAQRGSLIVAQGATLNVLDGPVAGDDLFVARRQQSIPSGLLTVEGTIVAHNNATIMGSISGQANIVFAANSTYEHAHQSVGGDIPIASWQDNSTVVIKGYTTSVSPPTGLSQNFYNFTWNAPNQQNYLDLSGQLTTVRGNLVFENTGRDRVILSEVNNLSLTVGLDFIIRSAAGVYLAYDQSSATVNIGKDFRIETNGFLSFTEYSPITVNVGNDLIVNGSGEFYLINSSEIGTGTGSTEIIVARNAIFQNGRLQNLGANLPDVSQAKLRLNLVSIPATGNFTFTNSLAEITGNWTNSGGLFNGSTSEFTFVGNPDAPQIITVIGNNQPFGVVSITNEAQVVVDASPMKVAGNFSVTTGSTFDLNAQQLRVGGNWHPEFGTFVHGNGELILDGAGTQTITTNGNIIGNLSITNSGIKVLENEINDIEGNLVISSGATLDVGEQNNYIFLKGNWQSDGTFLSRSGTVTFNGNATQNITSTNGTASEFYDLDLENTTGVRSGTHIKLKHILRLDNGVTFDADGPGNNFDFTLISDASNTAGIASIPAGSQILGNVVVERFISDKGIDFRYFATPITNATLADIVDDVALYLGDFASANIYFYNEATPGVVDEGWDTFPVDLQSPLEIGRGYALLMSEGVAKKLSISGPVQQGDVNLPISFNNSTGLPTGENVDDGWHLLGNPYPSSINWQFTWSMGTTITERSDIDPTIWISDHVRSTDPSNQYASFNAYANIGLNGGTQDIASGQGFWIKANQTSTLVFKEEYKSQNTGTTFFRNKEPEDVLTLRVTSKGRKDETALIFREGVSTGFDKGKDSYKLKNSIFSLSSLGANGEDLAYNILPWFDCSYEAPIVLDYATPGDYTFSFSNLHTFTRTIQFKLLDNYTGKQIVASETASYEFKVSEDPKSYGSERFILQATYMPLQLDLAITAASTCAGNNANLKVAGTQTDVMYQAFINDQEVSSAIAGNGGEIELLLNTKGMDAGVYNIVVKAGRQACTPLSLLNPVSLELEEVYEITSSEEAVSCGTGSVELTVAGAPEGAKYRWYASANAPEILAETSQPIFTTPVLTSDTWFYVSALNAKGCEGTRTKILAKVSDPVSVVINEQNGTLLANGEGTFQWYLNGFPIEGATTSTLTPMSNGSYQVELTNASGCLSESNEFRFEALGLNDLEKQGISLWPIPSNKGILYLSTINRSTHDIKLRLMSIEGKYLLNPRTNSLSSNVLAIEVDQLSSGVYILEIQEAKRDIVRARIVIN